MIKIRRYWVRVSPKSSDWCHYRRHTRTQRMEAKTGVMCLQSKEC